MKLEKKRALAARTLNVGKNRIVFNLRRLSELKEAITKQDIRDLYAARAISILEKRGRKKPAKSKKRRLAGSIKKKVKKRKMAYVILTRKLRAYLSNIKKTGQVSQDKFLELRRDIRRRSFRSLAHFKERIFHKGEEHQ